MPPLFKWTIHPHNPFWIVGITNTINLIDGLDGLASGVAMISALSLMLVAEKFGQEGGYHLSALVAGACLGFIPYNFNRLRSLWGILVPSYWALC